MCTRWKGLFLFFAFSALMAGASQSLEWPVFRGDLSQKGLAQSRLGGKLKILWKVEGLDSVEGTAAIQGDKVIVGALDGSVRCLELGTGKEIWKQKTGPVKAPVCWQGEVAYVGDIDGKFYSLEAKTGRIQWVFEAKGEISGGATVSGDRILFGSQDESIRCLDKAGHLVWDFRVEGPYYGSMAVAGGKTFAAGCDSTLHVIKVENGKEESKVELGGQTGATVSVDGDQLFIGTMNREFLRVDWKTGEIPWRFQSDNRPKEFFSSSAVTKDLVVVGSRDNRVYAFDRKTGKQVWTVLTKGHVDSSPVVSEDGVVHVGSLDGKLYSLDLAKGTQLGLLELDDGISASPAISGGKLVIGTQKGTLYCLVNE